MAFGPFQAFGFLLLFNSALIFSRAAIYDKATDLPTGNFDFIVIGGGTAGNVIANRLTEDPTISVLVLEAGGSDKNILENQVPFYSNRLVNSGPSPYNWNYSTTPQAGLGGRSIAYPRGFLIGGSSSVNFMGYTRGTSDDYDRYARVSGDEGWSWKSLQPYIRKNERFTQPVDHHNTTGEYNPAVHGYRGVNTVSLPGYKRPIDDMMKQATSELADEFPYNEDTNSGRNIGFGLTQSTIKNGSRSSSSTSYLAPRYLQRPNLNVLLNARVTRLLQTGIPGSHSLAFRGVEFTQDGGTSKESLNATKEIILSAGVIGSPTILMHSGIGDSNTLSSLGIVPIHHLPSVGQNLTDHPVVANPWNVNSTDTFETEQRNATIAAEELERWQQTRTGPLVTGLMGWLGWFRLPNNSSIFERFQDPSAGQNTGHFEYIISNGLTRPPTPPTGNFLGFSICLVTPVSRGSVTLNSSNPLDPPLINPNLLGWEFDLFVMREGFLKSRRFAAAPVWQNYLISEVNNVTDADLDDFIRNNAAAIYHPVGTAGMSPRDAAYGVVDPDLRVKGVDGLRIVDASVLPFVPAAHTQAAAYIFAERAADLIKEAHRSI